MNNTTKSLQNPVLLNWLAIVIVLAAFGLRMWQLNGVPPGWRDDELINSLVISQHALDGELAVYYADASGHEALYHLLNAVMLGLFGPNIVGIRLLSVFLGTLTVALTYQVGHRLFSKHVGLIAAAGLAFSFWSLMYSRIGLRHVLTPPLMLLTIYFFWQALEIGKLSIVNRQLSIVNFVLTGVFMALGMYTYFASRGVPLILAAFCGFVWVVDRARFKRHWVGMVVMFGVTAVLSFPLFITLSQQPESEARVAELAVPVVEAQQGNFEPLVEYTVNTLSMFHSTGDGEWLYNLPGRPVFGTVGAAFFWVGVVMAVTFALRVVVQQKTKNKKQKTKNNQRTTDNGQRLTAYGLPSAFLIAWWLAGISPSFISVPPASLGHTILAQPATFMLAALPIWRLGSRDWRLETGNWRLVSNLQSPISIFLALSLLLTIAARDWSDYFGNWPERGMVQFLYRGDYHDIADYLNVNPDITDVGVTGLLAGPWDKLALSIDLNRPVNVRWYNPQRVVLLEPAVSFAGFPDAVDTLAASWEPLAEEVRFGDYALMGVETAVSSPTTPATCFQNGLCVVSASFDTATHALDVTWAVERPLSLPDIPLISNPPPPNVYAGPRLSVFAHLLDSDGNLLTGDDGLWVDAATLQVGDTFWQQHWLQVPEGQVGTAVSFGLYDPMTGERVLTDEGVDQVRVAIEP